MRSIPEYRDKIHPHLESAYAQKKHESSLQNDDTDESGWVLADVLTAGLAMLTAHSISTLLTAQWIAVPSDKFVIMSGCFCDLVFKQP